MGSKRDHVAIVIAVGIVAWGLIAFGGMAWHGKSLGEVGGEALIAIGGGLVGALASYMAASK